jgi:hypothetical protein
MMICSGRRERAMMICSGRSESGDLGGDLGGR